MTGAVEPVIPADKHPDPAFIIIDKDKHNKFNKQLQYFNEMQSLSTNILWPQHLREVGKGGKEQPPKKALSQIGHKIRQTSVVKKHRQKIKAKRKWDEKEVWRQQSFHKMHLKNDFDVKVQTGFVDPDACLDPFNMVNRRSHLCLSTSRQYLKFCKNDFDKECMEEIIRNCPYNN